MYWEVDREQTRRLTFLFSGEILDVLEALQEITIPSTPAGVIKAALSALKWAEGPIRNGDRIVVDRKSDGALVYVEFPFLEGRGN